MRQTYRELFDEVHASGRLKEEVMNMTKQERTQVVKKVSVSFIIAAALAVLLAGTALAAAIGIPQTLQEWFGQQWTEAGGGEMPGEQSEVIESLVQPVGVSDTDNGVTVTLQSVTPGENCLWLKLEVEGPDFSKEDFMYEFQFIDLTGPFVEEHKPTTPGVGLGIGLSYLEGSTGVTKDGKLTTLIQCNFSSAMPYQDGGELTLKLIDIVYKMDNGSISVEGNLASGEWDLPFTIKPVEDRAALTADPAMVPASHEGEDLVPIKDIRVSSTGLTYTVDAPVTREEDGRANGPQTTFDIALRLSDGMEVTLGSYFATWTGEYGNSPWEARAGWTFPVDLSKAEAIRFGDVVVPLSQPKR